MASLEVSDVWKESYVTGGVGLGDVPCWRYQVRRRYASLEVSEGWKETCATGGIGLGHVPCWRYQKAKLCYSSGNTMH
jgi:hypothetical protein